MLPWKLRKRHILPVNQNLSSVYFSPAKFQLVSCNLSLATIWQMRYTHKLPKLCSATLNVNIMSIYFEFKIYIYQLRFSLFQIFSSNLSQLNVYIIYHHINSQLDHNYFNSFSILLSITNLTCYILDSI